MLIYIPVVGQDLVAYANQLNDYRAKQPDDQVGREEKFEVLVHGRGKGGLLSCVEEKDVFYVLAHGRETTANQVGAEVAAHSWWKGDYQTTKFLTAKELATQMEKDGLTKRCGDLRLLVCWAGLSRNNGKRQVPFAGQLCGAMKAKGFSRIIITGYNGAVMGYQTRNVIVEPGLEESRTNAYMAQAADEGDRYNAFQLQSSGDHGQSLYDIVMARNPQSIALRSVWY